VARSFAACIYFHVFVQCCAVFGRGMHGSLVAWRLWVGLLRLDILIMEIGNGHILWYGWLAAVDGEQCHGLGMWQLALGVELQWQGQYH